MGWEKYYSKPVSTGLKRLQHKWHESGKTDPLWSILTVPVKKGNKWQVNEFFQTGIEEINAVTEYVRSLGVELPRGKALDFGCGVGRLTQALSNYFDEAYGVDIAPSMIRLARLYNRHRSRCKYFLNESDDLQMFPDNCFVFVYSSITLQHIEPRYSKKYIKEFLRVLAPNGLLVFQLPSRPAIQYTKSIGRLIRWLSHIMPRPLIELYWRCRYGNYPGMAMYCIEQKEILEYLAAVGGQAMHVAEDDSAGEKWVSLRYYVVKA